MCVAERRLIAEILLLASHDIARGRGSIATEAWDWIMYGANAFDSYCHLLDVDADEVRRACVRNYGKRIAKFKARPHRHFLDERTVDKHLRFCLAAEKRA